MKKMKRAMLSIAMVLCLTMITNITNVFADELCYTTITGGTSADSTDVVQDSGFTINGGSAKISNKIGGDDEPQTDPNPPSEGNTEAQPGKYVTTNPPCVGEDCGGEIPVEAEAKITAQGTRGNKGQSPASTGYKGGGIGKDNKILGQDSDLGGALSEIPPAYYKDLNNCDDFVIKLEYTKMAADWDRINAHNAMHDYCDDNSLWEADQNCTNYYQKASDSDPLFQKEVQDFTSAITKYGSEKYYMDWIREQGYQKSSTDKDAYVMEGINSSSAAATRLNQLASGIERELVAVKQLNSTSKYVQNVDYQINVAYGSQADCYAALNVRLSGIIVQAIESQDYVRLDKDGTEAGFKDNCFEYEGQLGSNGEVGKKLYFTKNSTTGLYYDEEKPKTNQKWSSDYNAKIVTTKKELYKVEHTGKYDTRKIAYNHPTVDVTIKNIDNPKSAYYGKESILELNGSTGYSKFESIVARPFNKKLLVPMVEANGNSKEMKIDARIELDWARPFVPTEDKDLGTTQAIFYTYADIYYNFVFQMAEYKAMFFYVPEEDGYLKYALKGNPTSDCYKTNWRPFPRTYSGKLAIYDLGTGEDKGENPTVKSFVKNANEAFAPIKQKAAQGQGTTAGTPMVRGAYFIDGNGSAGWYNDGAGWSYFKNHPTDIYFYENKKPSEINLQKGWTLEKDGVFLVAQNLNNKDITNFLQMLPNYYTYTNRSREVWEYNICIGQYNCTCADINVLCDCADEEMGCTPEAVCDDPDNCDSGYDCSENPGAPECQCFEGGECEGGDWIPREGIPKTNNPGGKTGKGSLDYMDRYYNSTSIITN